MDFGVSEEIQQELDWVTRFVQEEVWPVDAVLGHPQNLADPLRQRLIPPLQAQVKERGLWAAHLPPEAGGMGKGQVRLALVNEILGSSRCAPTVFGCQAPDSGNSELLSLFASPAQRTQYLEPLLAGEIMSCFSMTEPDGGADPTALAATGTLQSDGTWRLSGEKWFASNARYADVIIIVVVTDPDAEPHRRASMFLLPRDTPGVEIVRNVASVGQPIGDGTHGYLRLNDAILSQDAMLGERGAAFAMAQARLGGGRIHHAMRTIGAARKALDMMCERAVSRSTKGSRLADLQLVQTAVAESWIDLEQFRLLVLRTAWKIDNATNPKEVRGDIAAVKAAMPKVYNDIVSRALQLHGSIGISDEMPFAKMLIEAFQMGLADGPTEVHKLTLGRLLLRGYEPVSETFPSYHIPTARARAEQKLEPIIGDHPLDPWY